MTATQTGRDASPRRSSRPAVANGFTVIVVAVVGAVAVNLMAYVLGRACGGAFTYTQHGRPTGVDALAVALMSGGPLAFGLSVAAWLTRRWPALITTAEVVATVLPVATIGVMTVPAGFDTTSAFFLAAMHLALVPAGLLALRALDPKR
jgi:Family of unknown function (DUF6069)